LTRAPGNEAPDLDKHRGITAQKAADIRRVLAEVETRAMLLCGRQSAVEIELLSLPAPDWPDAVAKARYVLNLYAASFAPADIHTVKEVGPLNKERRSVCPISKDLLYVSGLYLQF
jgi:hypothetical protein